MRPDLSRVPEFYHNYIRRVEEDELMTALRNNTRHMLDFFSSIPPVKREYRYAEDKWTIKELLQHLVDSERIFSYRALRFARKDPTPLAGFEENHYVANAHTERRKWEDLLEEFKSLRIATELLFASFDKDQLQSPGTANNNSIYVLALGFIIAGHCNHHMQIVRERYLEKSFQL